MKKSIEEVETEFDFFKLMIIGKLHDGELDGECLERMIDQVYWLGHYVGRCREREYQNK